MICFYKLIITVKRWQNDQTNNFNLFHFSRSLSQHIKISSSLNKNNLQLFIIASQLEFLNTICYTFWAIYFVIILAWQYFQIHFAFDMSPCVGEPCMSCYSQELHVYVCHMGPWPLVRTALGLDGKYWIWANPFTHKNQLQKRENYAPCAIKK